MKSTWRRGNRDEWTIFHRLYEVLGIHPTEADKIVPPHSKEDSVPYLSHWQLHRWLLFHALIPLAIHHAYVSYIGGEMGPTAVFLFYTTSFILICIDEVHLLRDLIHTYGVFDGDKYQRDDVPDNAVRTLLGSFALVIISRMMVVFLSYNIDQTPGSMNWRRFPLELGVYSVIYDFWFYWFHRLFHEVDGLWQYHRTHHLAKHPNMLLTAYINIEDLFVNIFLVPPLAWGSLSLIGLPMGFYEWWICTVYITFTEMFGHSGLRVYASSPSPFTWLLRYLDAELIIEDHDLHHRDGWMKSYNYGKHTRLWDRIFGTCYDRVECLESNIDYGNKVILPLVSMPFHSPFLRRKLVKKDWTKRGRAQVDRDAE